MPKENVIEKVFLLLLYISHKVILMDFVVSVCHRRNEAVCYCQDQR